MNDELQSDCLETRATGLLFNPMLDLRATTPLTSQPPGVPNPITTNQPTAQPKMKEIHSKLNAWAMDRHLTLVVLLLNSWIFAFFASALALCILLVPLATWKTIPSTPTGMPEIKVSLLDLLQAKSFSHRAHRLAPTADPEIKLDALSMAIGNAPGNADYNRQYLDALTTHDLGRERWFHAARTGHWLLKLTRTNAVDLERVLRAFNHYGMHDFTIGLYQSLPHPAHRQSEHEYLSALIHVGTLAQIQSAWQERSQNQTDEPLMSLIQSAMEALSDEPTQAQQGKAELAHASADPALETKAIRLRLLVAQHQNSVTEFETALKHLDTHFQTSVYDHLAFWSMLTKNGQKEEAVRAAKALILKPKTAREVVSVGNAYYQLGLSDLAFQHLANHANDYGFNSEIWITKTQILVQEKNWSGLHQLARQLRLSPGASQAYLGFSHFLDAKAHHEEGRPRRAQESADDLLSYSFSGSSLGLYVASNLWKLQLPEAAMHILWEEQERYRNDSVFWDLTLRVAANLGRERQALVASENLFRIDPDNHANRANCAAILLSERIQVDHALALTLDAMLHYPGNMDLRVNYARALTLNLRFQDAADTLGIIDMKQLTADGLNAYRFVSMELFLSLQKRSEAMNVAASINPDQLLPADRIRFLRIVNQWNTAIAKAAQTFRSEEA